MPWLAANAKEMKLSEKVGNDNGKKVKEHPWKIQSVWIVEAEKQALPKAT